MDIINKQLELVLQNSVYRYSYTIKVARPYGSDPVLTTKKRVTV